MKRRLTISIIAALVYTATFAGITVWRGEELHQADLVIGALVFAVTFYAVRTWLDKRRYQQHDTAHSDDENTSSD